MNPIQRHLANDKIWGRNKGSVALPGEGMAAIVDQLEDDLPPDLIRTGIRVQSIHPGGVELKTGEHIDGSAVVLATDAKIKKCI